MSSAARLKRLTWPGTVLCAALSIAGCGGGTDDEKVATESLPRTFFGIDPLGPEREPGLRMMAEGGVGTYRVTLSWPAVQPYPSVPPRWDEVDALMLRLAKNGIEPLVVFLGSSVAVSGEVFAPPIETTEQRNQWRAFVGAAVSRYGQGGTFWSQEGFTSLGIEPQPVRTWEVWNEPNSAYYWSPVPSPYQYAQLLHTTAPVIRQADPDATVMTGGMFGASLNPKSIPAADFLRELYRVHGIRRDFDVVGVHPYAPDLEGVAGQYEALMSVIRDAGDKSVTTWVTEVGAGSSGTSTSQLALDPAGQADYLRSVFDLFIREREDWRIEGVVWFTWRDGQNRCGVCPSVGLVSTDLEPKPAWHAFTEYTGGRP